MKKKERKPEEKKQDKEEKKEKEVSFLDCDDKEYSYSGSLFDCCD